MGQRVRQVACFGLALFCSAATAAPQPASSASCLAPVRREDTLASIRARFGKDARIETVSFAEGETGKALVLYHGDKARRIEVLFNTGGARLVQQIRWQGKGWTAAGLTVGDSAARIAALNGKPFSFFGFDWDYGGYVTQLRGGRLQKLPGGCKLGIRLRPGAGNGNALTGDGEFRSTEPAFRRHPPVIEQLSLAW